MQRYLGTFEGGAFAIMRIVFAFLYWSHGPSLVVWLVYGSASGCR